MPTNETKIMTSLSTVINFIKDNIKNDVITASRMGMIKVDTNDVPSTERLCNVICNSIDASYAKSINEVLSAIKTIK